MNDDTAALTPVGSAEKALVNISVKTTDAAKLLLALPVEQRCVAIAGSFEDTVSASIPAEMDRTAETLGRRYESVFDEMSPEERKATVRRLIENGDTEVVLAMVRGHSGDLSTTVEYLDQDLVELLFEQDQDMNDPEVANGRVVPLNWTLIVKNPQPTAVVRFFLYTPAGDKIRQMLSDIAAAGDEDAQYILTHLRELSARVLEEDDATEEDE